MASSDDSSKATILQRVARISEIEGAKVKLTPDDRLQVEFRIEDLVRKLIPGGINPAAHCNGCNGCSGCSM